jgi:hypothetical protein
MAPASLTVLHSAFLTLTSVALGRLVTDPTNPSQDFWPETSSPMDPTQIDQRDFTAYHDTMTNEKSDELKAKLTKFVTGDISREKSSTNDISTSTSYVYSLFQPRATFTKLCGDSATKQWIESTLKDCPIFLVVGLVTVLDAAAKRDSSNARTIAGSTTVPVGEIVTGGASAVLPAALGGDTLDVGVSASFGHKDSSSSSFIAPGERVIGVQYRKIKFRLFSSRSAESAFLENNPNRWKMFMGGDRAGSDDSLEADFEESMEIDDLELDQEPDSIVDEDAGFVFIDS